MNNNWIKQLSKTYINLTEENNAEKLLEYKKPKTRYLDVVDYDTRHGGLEPATLIGSEVTKKGNPVGKGARKRKLFTHTPSYNSKFHDDAYQVAEPPHAYRDTSNNAVIASLYGRGPAIPVDVRGGREEFDEVGRGDYGANLKGGSVPGMGKKARKKELAIELEKIRAQEAKLAAELARHEEG